MSDDLPPDETEFDSETLEEWAKRTAESKGISKSDLLDQMLSSYWILEELTTMMEDTELEATQGDREERNSPPSERRVPREGEESDQTNPSPEPSLSELFAEFENQHQAIRELLEKQHGLTDSEQSQPQADQFATPSGPPNPVDQWRMLTDLQEDLQDLSEDVTDTQRQYDEVEQLSATVDDALEQLEALEAAIEDAARQEELSELADSHEELAEEVSRIERSHGELETDVSRLEETSTELRGNVSEVTDVTRELQSELSRLDQDTQDLTARIERNFDNIETLFERVLRTTDELGDRIEETNEAYQEELEPLRDAHREQSRLAEIKQAALLEGVSTAVCENCDEPIELGLLAEPRCPGCTREFSGLTEKSWVPFRKPRLETDPIRSTSSELDGFGDGTRTSDAPTDRRHPETQDG